MKVTQETYKGIDFVRISSLPENQKRLFWQSFDKNKIIKILKSDSLLNDCIQYHEYSDWFTKNFKQEMISPATSQLADSSRQHVLQVA
jgi:hypothetical protein